LLCDYLEYIHSSITQQGLEILYLLRLVIVGTISDKVMGRNGIYYPASLIKSVL